MLLRRAPMQCLEGRCGGHGERIGDSFWAEVEVEEVWCLQIYLCDGQSPLWQILEQYRVVLPLVHKRSGESVWGWSKLRRFARILVLCIADQGGKKSSYIFEAGYFESITKCGISSDKLNNTFTLQNGMVHSQSFAMVSLSKWRTLIGYGVTNLKTSI
jgi:hypothetical protein